MGEAVTERGAAVTAHMQKTGDKLPSLGTEPEKGFVGARSGVFSA